MSDDQLDVIAAARDAIDRVGSNADPVWTAVTRRAVLHICTTRRSFTTDDIWDAIERYYPEITTHENRAMGAVMTWAVARGLAEVQSCRVCGTRKVMRPSRRVSSHGTDTAIYVSKVFGQASAA